MVSLGMGPAGYVTGSFTPAASGSLAATAWPLLRGGCTATTNRIWAGGPGSNLGQARAGNGRSVVLELRDLTWRDVCTASNTDIAKALLDTAR